jgi:Kef-type K+ transport system membrane component KefB
VEQHAVLFTVFLIFSGAAVLATAALYARQTLLIAYILLGVLLGSSGLDLVGDLHEIENIAHAGIIFLLFLLGLNLYPQKLVQLLREATAVTLLTSSVFGLLGYAVAWAAGFDATERVVVGVAMMFSSTILGLKLLPTTVLHHRRTGEIIVSILLLQDLVAIVALLILTGTRAGVVPWQELVQLGLALPALAGAALLAERYVMQPLFQRFDRIQEYVFLLALGWCLGVATLGQALGLSYEIGAFLAGVAVAASPIARFIAESLKPLRDFFLIMFFFAIGAGLEITAAASVALPALALALFALFVKPPVFKLALTSSAERAPLAWEIGWRLGQMSEFSILIVFLARGTGAVSQEVSTLIELATILTFIGSSYLIVFRYPTPIALSDRLRRD